MGLSPSYGRRTQPHSPVHRVVTFLSQIRAQAPPGVISFRFHVAPAWLENAASDTPQTRLVRCATENPTVWLGTIRDGKIWFHIFHTNDLDRSLKQLSPIHVHSKLIGVTLSEALRQMFHAVPRCLLDDRIGCICVVILDISVISNIRGWI